MRDRAVLGRVLLVVACVAVVAGSATRQSAQASHCVVTPALAKAAIGQGLPYARLVRGKETLVKAYLTLPASLPKCAGTTPAIKIVGATLTMRNGTTPLVTGLAPLSDAIGALITSKSTAKNQPADPKFVLRGSQLPPSGSGITGSFTASFEITVQYQSKGAAVQGTPDAFSSTQSVTFTSAAGSPISRAVEGQTKALRILAVPMGTSLDATMTSTLEAGLTSLSGMYPVQDLTGSGQPRVGVLPTTAGGIRYAINSPGMVNVGTLPFCGTSLNYGPIQTQLQGFHNAYNDLNATENDVDRTIGVVPSTASTGSTDPNCFEGFTVTNTKEAWVRVIPDAQGASSMTGSLLGMELCHTFGCSTSTTTSHSLYMNADNLAENVDLAFNPLTWSWLSDDRSAMRFTPPGWNNSTTVFEKGDFGYLLCGLGGANTSGCPTLGTGTLTGVAAGGTFLLDGTTDGLGQTTTSVLNSFASTVQPQTTPVPTSQYRLLQKNSAGQILTTGLGDLGVPVQFVHSGHGGDDDVGAGAIGGFSFALPLDSQTARIEFVKRLPTGGTTLLYGANRTAPPQIDSVTVTAEEPITLLARKDTSAVAPRPSSAASPRARANTPAGTVGASASAVPSVAGSSTKTSAAAAVEATGLSNSYTFNGEGGYSADGLGQIGTGGLIQADVPAGSTVQKAFLYGTYFSNHDPDATQRTIDFDGTMVVTTKIGDDGSSSTWQLSTTRADVTAQVAAKVGSGGVVTDFSVNTDPSSLDGVGLVVVYSNPASPTTTVAVLDGTASQAGDTATFTFASPLDKTVPDFSATMSLGSGFGYQGGLTTSAGTSECGAGSPQASLVDVNASRLTSCAGNYDDGFGQNGGLITVGGVGDNTANPAYPMQQPGDGTTPRGEDDELYDIASFTSQGDTQLTITSSNPSQDDNLFLAVIQVAAQATVTTEICDDGIDNDGDELIDGDDPDCAPPPGPGTVQVVATDEDTDPEDLRATCYVDWGGVKFPVEVSASPSSVDEETGEATFECSFDPATIGATDAGTARVTVVVHDRFTQSAPAEETFSSEQTPPVASIAAPSPALEFASPPANNVELPEYLQFESIILRGSATDAEDKHLTPADLAWSAPGLFAGALPGEHVLLPPPSNTGWTPGTYEITLTATDSDGNTSSRTAWIRILADADHDGIPVHLDFATCTPPTSGDNNALNASADPDVDGIPNIDDQYTAGGPCVRQDTYSAIIDWDPDDLQRNTSGTPITVKVRVPYRNVSDIVSSTVKITKVVYVNTSGDVVEEAYTQPNIGWTAKGQDGTAKFDRLVFINQFLNPRGIANQRIVVEVSGDFTGTPTTHWAGRDSTNVK